MNTEVFQIAYFECPIARRHRTRLSDSCLEDGLQQQQRQLHVIGANAILSSSTFITGRSPHQEPPAS